MSAPKGLFISFEGGEGAGKSTQIRRLARVLEAQGREVIVTREPGGSPGAEAIRHVLLSGAAEDFGAPIEAILFAAARTDHLNETIRPALDAGKVVLCDRFIDSSRVYQGVTGHVAEEFMSNLQRVAVNGCVPDRTLIFDLPAEIGLQRAYQRSVEAGQTMEPDRFERETVETHDVRRQAFLRIAQAEPERCRLIDANQNEDAVAAAVLAVMSDLLDQPIAPEEAREGVS